jgi:tetratricopeptide (TPR) repeat protein
MDKYILLITYFYSMIKIHSFLDSWMKESLGKNTPDDIEKATMLNNLAGLHCQTKQYRKAEKEYRKALNIRKQLTEENLVDCEAYVAETLKNLGVLHDKA